MVDTLRTASGAVFGPAGPWLYDVFDILNRECWGGRLPRAMLNIAITPHGGCLGLTKTVGAGVASSIAISPGTLNPNAWLLGEAAGWRHSATVLLHEMVHIAQHWLYAGLPSPGETSHNNDLWCREANRIGKMIGLPPICTRFVVKRTPEGIRRLPQFVSDYPITQEDVGRWPHSIASIVTGNLPAWQIDVCEKLGITAPASVLSACRV